MGVIKNYTPHPITLVIGGSTITLPSDGAIRVEQKDDITGHITIDGIHIPIKRVSFGNVNIPNDIGDVNIVSLATLNAIRDQYPDISHLFYGVCDPVRNDCGQIIGAQALFQ